MDAYVHKQRYSGLMAGSGIAAQLHFDAKEWTSSELK